MSDERENTIVPDPGAPVEEQTPQESAVQEAVDRATAITDEGLASETAVTEATPEVAAEAAKDSTEVDDLAHKEAASLVDTQMNLDHPTADEAAASAETAEGARVAEYLETPSAAAETPIVAAPVKESPVRDGEIRIEADHPMAALYMQTPMPPDLKGNRGAGALIALLATVVFAVLYAGIVALSIATAYPPSTFLAEGLLPIVTSWSFIAGVIAFYLGLLILVLIFGRAGWWAYVLFSLFVGVLVWFATTGTLVVFGDAQFGVFQRPNLASGVVDTARAVGFAVQTLGAGVLAREVAVWFGAWIGARGRKVSAKNAELLAEYETALAEVRTQQ